ncbi:hypothetical protein GPECTOR_380g178 [Gonium pectorale]|uniref:Uncharacterized protein n=1 Tax=Gonium pectorale TaxID=33097 RepID=A0A150FVD3_GONPE|nr:hypothetical protein GPECTOR_380g178 [Gonium pectorale]|eukprot:KXZ41581.1 hypothetical protein GPECTOR_380g178 [Gonium pectorale]
MKLSMKSRDMSTLAAASTRPYKKASAKMRTPPGSDRRERLPGCGPSRLPSNTSYALTPGAPSLASVSSTGGKPTLVTTFQDRAPLDSPVIIAGSSCFSQLPQIVAAIRSAPPVGSARRFRICPIVILDDSKTSPLNPYKARNWIDAPRALLGESLLSAIGRVPGAQPQKIFVLRGSPQDAADITKLNLEPGGTVHALLVPNTELYTEEAVVGSAPAMADGQVMLAADALRSYCDAMDCRLSVVSEVLALLNCSYTLPLCLPEGPYRDGRIVRTQTPSLRHLTSQAVDRPKDRMPTWSRKLLSLRRNTTGHSLSRQEAYVQYILSAMPHLSPSLAPGHILMQTFMDALLCQTIFNPMMLQILFKMLHCWDDHEDGNEQAAEGQAQGTGGAGAGDQEKPQRLGSASRARLGLEAMTMATDSPRGKTQSSPVSVSTTVRIFCFNFASMTRRMSGLHAALLREQRLRDEQQQAAPHHHHQHFHHIRQAAAGRGAGGDGATTLKVNWQPGLARAECDAAAALAGDGAATDGGDGYGKEVLCEEDQVALKLRGSPDTPSGTVHGGGSMAAAPVSVTFGVLFEVLVEKYDMLPLGLYRRDDGPLAAPKAPDGSGRASRRRDRPSAGGFSADGTDPSVAQSVGSGMPYVYTKPGASKWLRSSDDVYVLTSPAAVLEHMGPTA